MKYCRAGKEKGRRNLAEEEIEEGVEKSERGTKVGLKGEMKDGDGQKADLRAKGRERGKEEIAEGGMGGDSP